MPLPKQTLRVGVTDDTDIGISLISFSPALGVSAKQMFLEEPVDGAVYLGGEVFFFGFDDFGFGYGNVNPRVVFSQEAEGVFPFMASAGLDYLWGFGYMNDGAASDGCLWAVGTLGLPVRFGSERQIRMMPAIELGVPIYSHWSDYEGEALRGGMMASLGVSIGTAKSDQSRPSSFRFGF
jgi:hypothetical protein